MTKHHFSHPSMQTSNYKRGKRIMKRKEPDKEEEKLAVNLYKHMPTATSKPIHINMCIFYYKKHHLS